MPGQSDNAKWKRQWEGKPLLPTSHITHFLKRAVIHRETPLHKCSVLACICCLQLLERNQSVKTQDAGPRRQHLHRILWVAWKLGLGPDTLQLRSTLTAGFRQNYSRKTSCAPLSLQGHLHYFLSLQPVARLQHITWALPCVPSMLVACWHVWDLK